jgi:hypothetical protein
MPFGTASVVTSAYHKIVAVPCIAVLGCMERAALLCTAILAYAAKVGVMKGPWSEFLICMLMKKREGLDLPQ